MANGRNICSVLLAAILILGGWVWYAKASEGGELFGPLSCPACKLESPEPGVGTRTFLEAWAWDVRHTYWPPNQMYVNVNDKIMVCNGQSCVTYTLTDSGQYFGGKRESQTSSPGTGGGGGGSPQGPVLPGGGGGGKIGVVEIGPISKPPGGSSWPPGVELEECSLGGAKRLVPKGGCDF